MATRKASDLSRRTVLKGVGIGAAVAWTTPVIASVAAHASAASGLLAYDLTANYLDASGGNLNPPWAYDQSAASLPDAPTATLSDYAPISGSSPGGLNGFQGGNDADANGTFPFVTKNTTGSNQVFAGTDLTYDAGDVYGHPGNSTDLLIRFTSPYPAGTTGTVKIGATPIHSCTAGIVVSVAGGTVSAGPTTVAYGGAFSFSQSGVDLGPGTTIDLILAATPAGYDCDSTLLSFTVTPV